MLAHLKIILCTVRTDAVSGTCLFSALRHQKPDFLFVDTHHGLAKIFG